MDKISNLVSSSALGLAGLQAYNAYNSLFNSGSRDISARNFANGMAYTRAPSRRVAGARRKYVARRPMRYTRPYKTSNVKTYTRQSNVGAYVLAAGVGTSYADPSLSFIQTSDLITAFDVYRIKKVTAIFTPLYDPANGSSAANDPPLHFIAACDTAGNVTGFSDMKSASSYESHRYKGLMSGEKFYYTFYPKAVNEVGVSGVASALGSYTTNPWLLCNAAGVTVPHQRLAWRVECFNVTNVQAYDVFYRITFEVKRFH